MLYPLGEGGGLWWKFEIKTQDRTLSKNNNPRLVFYLKLIIWNIDIHTCLLDSTFLCPHLLIINNLFFAKIKVAPFGFHSCIFWKFYLFVIKLNDSIVDEGGPPMSSGNQYFQIQSATGNGSSHFFLDFHEIFSIKN